MPTYDDYTSINASGFSGSYELVGNDPSDATDSGYFTISGDEFLDWIQSEMLYSVAIADLTASTGSASDTISDVGSSFNQTTLNNNFKSLAEKFNALNTALENAAIISKT